MPFVPENYTSEISITFDVVQHNKSTNFVECKGIS